MHGLNGRVDFIVIRYWIIQNQNCMRFDWSGVLSLYSFTYSDDEGRIGNCSFDIAFLFFGLLGNVVLPVLVNGTSFPCFDFSIVVTTGSDSYSTSTCSSKSSTEYLTLRKNRRYGFTDKSHSADRKMIPLSGSLWGPRVLGYCRYSRLDQILTG